MSRKATIPIYHDDDFERMSDLRREVQIAERKLEQAKSDADDQAGSARRFGDDVSSATLEATKEQVAQARAAFTEFVDEAAGRAEEWVLRPIGHEEFRELLRAHPPRKVKKTAADGTETETTHPDDLAWSVVLGGSEVNTETYPKALLTYIDPDDEDIRTVEAPFGSAQEMRKRVKQLSAGEVDSMWVAAHLLNTGGIADPRSSDFYDGPRRSDET